MLEQAGERLPVDDRQHGGKLTSMGTEAGAAVGPFSTAAQPRAAVLFFGLLWRLCFWVAGRCFLQNEMPDGPCGPQERNHVSVPAVNTRPSAGRPAYWIVFVV